MGYHYGQSDADLGEPSASSLEETDAAGEPQTSDEFMPEEWPRRVTFSERSRLHLYRPDPGCARDKSYSKAERQGFGSEALAEALRIKTLVASAPGASAKDAFRRLLQEKELRLEEIVGLEHLVWGKSASKVLRDRKAHAQAVLKEQGKQRHLEKMAVLKEDPTETLGRFAASRSVKAAKRARIRAAMAA